LARIERDRLAAEEEAARRKKAEEEAKAAAAAEKARIDAENARIAQE
jgi:hypothetical protein